MNIILRSRTDTPHHGQLRTLAIQPLTAPWILYLDSDETFTGNMKAWLDSGELERYDICDFMKYSTIIDRYHYTSGGEGPSTRLFRNLPGVHFPQEIHTHPEHPGLVNKRMIEGVWLFDHTSVKSREALWAKGARYAWANRLGVTAVGPVDEYIIRIDDALSHADTVIKEFGEPIRSLIFTGPV